MKRYLGSTVYDIYFFFPEYKTVYGKSDAKSGILILRAAPLPEEIYK